MSRLTELELRALARGEATIYRGRVIPIMRGGDGTEGEGAAGDGAGGEGSGGAEGGGTGAGAGDGGGQGSGTQNAVDEPKSYTQAELDRMFQDRVARERQKYADYDDLKAKAGEFDKLQDAQKTELEREREARAKAERDLIETRTQAQETRVRSAIVAEAARRQMDPDVATAMLDRSLLEFDQDGSPTNIVSAMDSLLEAKPQLAGGGSGGSGDPGLGARGSKGQLTTTDGMSAEEIAAALADGRLDQFLKTANK